MADEKTWSLSELRAEVRKLTGRSETADISDAEVNKLINDYYVNHFPSDAGVNEFDGFFTQSLSATDDGVYDVAQNIDRLDDPVTINNTQIFFYRDEELFFSGTGTSSDNKVFINEEAVGLGYYKDEQYITDPNLVIGTSDTTKVKHDAFSYTIDGFSYSKATSEVALTGSDVPQNKYGAWSLKIDEDGTITVAEATDNVTGYATARKALDDMGESDTDSAFMGYVTAIKTDGVFSPGTTALDATNVTSTFTDGKFEDRGMPLAACLYGQKLYLRPKPNDIYQLEALTIADRPTALQNDSDAPDDLKWGPMIALMTAWRYLKSVHDDERADELASDIKVNKDAVELDKYKRYKHRILQAKF
jgi:hypothetical protein